MPRIRPIRTEAIVLRQRPLGDADRICVLFSPTRGRIEAVAKGVRKPLSKAGRTRRAAQPWPVRIGAGPLTVRRHRRADAGFLAVAA